jgi:hypothetical protein
MNTRPCVLSLRRIVCQIGGRGGELRFRVRTLTTAVFRHNRTDEVRFPVGAVRRSARTACDDRRTYSRHIAFSVGSQFGQFGESRWQCSSSTHIHAFEADNLTLI